MLPSRGSGRSRTPKIICSAKKKGGAKPAKKQEESWNASSASPPRITDTSQFSLKSQLRFVRNMKKHDTDQSSRPVVRQAFRRKKEPKAEEPEPERSGIEEEAMLRKGRGLKSLYNTKNLQNPPAVLVDGYNILMRWLDEDDPNEKARKLRVKGDLEAGRTEILRDLSEYSSWCKFRMMVAFDAIGNLEAPTISRNTTGGVEVVFVRGEADSFIIGEAQELRKAGCPYVLVASSDNDVRDACWTNDVVPVHASQLLREIKKAKAEADIFYKRSRAKGPTDRLGSVLLRSNPAVHERLEQARVQGIRHLN